MEAFSPLTALCEGNPSSNSRYAGDLRRNRAHHDVMLCWKNLESITFIDVQFRWIANPSKDSRIVKNLQWFCISTQEKPRDRKLETHIDWLICKGSRHITDDTKWLNSSMFFYLGEAQYTVFHLCMLVTAQVTLLIARFMGPTWGPSGADRT